MTLVNYGITLLEPTLVTALEGDPNSSVSHSYLPGSVLRGMLINLAMRHNKLAELDLADPDVRRRFFDGSTRFLNGYLVIKGQRSLPAPRSWEQNKYAENGKGAGQILDRALFSDQEETNQAKPGSKTKSLSGKFTVFETAYGSEVYIEEPKRVINVHTERDRKRGRSAGKNLDNANQNEEGQAKREGTIYRYDALEAGQTFAAQILCNHDDDAKYFKALLESYPSAVVGGARTAGYGRVKIHAVEIKEREREVGGEILQDADTLVLTLLSDTILRNSHGQYSPDARTLVEALAIRLSLDVKERGLDKVKVFKGESIVGGFNRKWGLPLPQVQALAMGSVFVIDISGLSKDVKQELQSLEWLGLGERRAEGFGRVAVGWQQHIELKLKKDGEDSNNSGQPDPSLQGKAAELWQRMEDRIKRRKTDRDMLEAANKLRFDKLPPPSQLNRLRQHVTTAMLKTTFDTTFITTFFTDIKGKRAGEHFEKAKVDGKSMEDWLKEMAKEADKYVALRLIDSMLANAVKYSQDKAAQNGGQAQ